MPVLLRNGNDPGQLFRFRSDSGKLCHVYRVMRAVLTQYSYVVYIAHAYCLCWCQCCTPQYCRMGYLVKQYLILYVASCLAWLKTFKFKGHVNPNIFLHLTIIFNTHVDVMSLSYYSPPLVQGVTIVATNVTALLWYLPPRW